MIPPTSVLRREKAAGRPPVARALWPYLACASLALGAAATTAREERELKVTPELEQAVSRGLAFLARTQRPDGAWPGQHGQVSGVVGLAMLAFLAHGEMPGEGRYGQVISRAADYILRNQEPNGLLVGEDRSSPMYSHGFATLALAELYGHSDDPRIGPALKKAVGLILAAQNATGGWRYNVNSRDADTTVSGAQMIALRAAAQAGIEVPHDAIRRGVEFYKACFCIGGGFGYTGAHGPNAARSGIGLLVLSLSGEYHSDEAKATADWLYNNIFRQEPNWMYYAAYYDAQAMYQAGGKYWRLWNETMAPEIIRRQAADGSWNSGQLGPTVDTALALLALEVNYNLLPIYQR